MWLPNKNETQKWLMENFDKTEFPEIPNLPLPDVFEDMVGNLLEEQENLGQQVEDAASNNLMAQNPANGWEVRDGPMPGYGAQGRTGNERPEKMEQSGRSSGGREGMSTGEMVGDTAKKLEGSSIDTRRTQDPFQQGMVKDESGPSEAKATGGGKAGAFSDRQGMEGNAPLRSSNAPRQLAADALAVQQALLAQKAAKTMAQAQLFYLRADGVGDASRLMEQAQWALKTGRIGDYKNLHQRIVRQLQTAKGDITGGKVLELGGNEPPRGDDKQLLGGSEGGVPNQYKDMVAEYYRSLAEVK
jgi:hypothetical protein